MKIKKIDLITIVFLCGFLVLLSGALGRKGLEKNKIFVCKANQLQIGKAFSVYANDNSYKMPVFGKTNTLWAKLDLQNDYWQDEDINFDNIENATVSSSLYLLVRETGIKTKCFVCPDGKEKPFTGKSAEGERNLSDLWDFGGDYPDPERPRDCVSYSYQMPYTNLFYTPHPAKFKFNSRNAILADKNPWFDCTLFPKNEVVTTSNFNEWEKITRLITDDWTVSGSETGQWRIKVSNSSAHNRNGQNVLYSDGHIEFQQRSDVGMMNDNIYTALPGYEPWDETMIRQGSGYDTCGIGRPKAIFDSFLVNDDQN